MGNGIAHAEGVEFFYHDFREGWKEGVEISKKSGMYRQQYCGCIYSEKARFLEKPPSR
jgi:predicted adenine nucleotide alpha hydrolase (AANH) superfamily ATPase